MSPNIEYTHGTPITTEYVRKSNKNKIITEIPESAKKVLNLNDRKRIGNDVEKKEPTREQNNDSAKNKSNPVCVEFFTSIMKNQLRKGKNAATTTARKNTIKKGKAEIKNEMKRNLIK